MRRRTARHDRRWRLRDTAVAVAAILVTGLAGGCGALGGGTKPAGEARAPADPMTALRQEVDRLRADLGELRTRVETVQRTGTEHADRAAQETRAEIDAVQKAMEASARNDLQRQVEVLDAQARRIDLLERRAAELGQALRQVELGLVGLESQLTRVLDRSSGTPAPGARGGSPARPPTGGPGSRPTEEPAPSAPLPESTLSTAAAGAGLTPPAMLGPSRSPRSPAPAAAAAPASEAQVVDSVERPRAEEAPPAAKRTDALREAKAAVPVRPTLDNSARSAKAAPSAPETTAAVSGRGAGAAPPRQTKTGPSTASPATGALTARALFDRAMENWKKSEQGQAVLDFEELVQTFPSDPLAGSAQFRIGEAYYTARDFDRAAIEYRKVVELAPKGKDTPQALLRLGLAYRAQKRESDARQAWNQLVRDFPESDAAAEARRALGGR